MIRIPGPGSVFYLHVHVGVHVAYYQGSRLKNDYLTIGLGPVDDKK